MRRLSLTALTLAVAASLIGSASAPAATKACSDNDRFLQQLKATHVGCKKARKVMFGWARSSSCIKGGDGLLADRARTCTVQGFRCVPKKAEGGVRVRCAKGTASLRFFDSQG